MFLDADLDRKNPGVAEAVMLNSGQACTAGSRLYTHIVTRELDQP
ncbi:MULTISPECIES: aldehyde dehydrogenase family protein [Paraburkholderia]